MTVTVGWINEGSIFQYRFTPEWTWQEFQSARRVAETVLKNALSDPEKLIDVVIDYTGVGNWFPKLPKKHSEPPMGYAENDTRKMPKVENNRKKKRRNGKGKHRHGHDPVIPRDKEVTSPNVPEELLNEHDWIIGVDTVFVAGATTRALRVFKTMMQPAYEWDFFEEIDSPDTVVELNIRDSDDNSLPQQGSFYSVSTEMREATQLRL